MRTRELSPANDDAPAQSGATDLVSAHLDARRLDRRIMISAAALAVTVLSVTLVTGFQSMQVPPDIVTFAFRV